LNFLIKSRAIGVGLVLALLILWELSARLKWVDSTLWPPFSSVLAEFWDQFVHQDLLVNVWKSLQRMFIGYLSAAAIGVGIGLLMGYYRFLYRLLEPLTEALRPIPSPAYIPIAILFLGIGDQMKIAMITLGCVFPILLNTYSGVRSIDPVQINTGRTFGLHRTQILWQIVVPASMPYIFTGLRISLAVALILAIISEMVAANDGVGYFILSMEQASQVAPMYAGIITLALLGYGLNRIFLSVEHWSLYWHYIATEVEDGNV